MASGIQVMSDAKKQSSVPLAPGAGAGNGTLEAAIEQMMLCVVCGSAIFRSSCKTEWSCKSIEQKNDACDKFGTAFAMLYTTISNQQI